MIKPSKDGTKLWFLPSEKSTEQEMEFDLVYAHVCPKCNNLIQALFMTDKRIDPKPWEEIFTRSLDEKGQYKRIIPGRQDRFRSRYSVTTLGRGATVSAELIRFTEHFDRGASPNDLPICNYAAISTTIPEYRVYDMLLAALMDPASYTLKDGDYEHVKYKIQHGYAGSDQYVFVPAVGKGHEVVLVSRTPYRWFIQDAVAKFYKPYVAPVTPVSF
jgi:hypothetical protein